MLILKMALNFTFVCNPKKLQVPLFILSPSFNKSPNYRRNSILKKFPPLISNQIWQVLLCMVMNPPISQIWEKKTPKPK
jgi:hypothetical protein